jgi:hypothetical protein
LGEDKTRNGTLDALYLRWWKLVVWNRSHGSNGVKELGKAENCINYTEWGHGFGHVSSLLSVASVHG